jgi:Flp pilus assembly protein TadB
MSAVYVAGLVMGLGLAGILVFLVSGRHPLLLGGLHHRAQPLGSGVRRPGVLGVPGLLVAVGAGVVCTLATGWPVAGPIGALAAYGVPRLLRGTSAATSIATVEAVATWTEMLQGTLAASAGLGQAIIATADLSPAPIRQATERLAAEIRAGVEPRTALLRFADEVGDPCADRVVCALLLAFTARAQRLGELLSALAESTREEVALRLRVETSRASVRSGVRTVVVFSLVFAAGLSLLARSYLSPFGSASGQVVLVVVAGLYAAGLTLMVTLARPPRPVRLLGAEVQVR